MYHHVEQALRKAEEYERNGDKENAQKFFAIAEKYEKILDEARQKDDDKKQNELYG